MEMTGALPATTMDFVVPIQYQPDGPNSFVLNDIESIYEAAKQGRFVTGAVIRSLQESKWTFERIITYQSKKFIIQGEAQFNLLEQNYQLIYTEKEKLSLSLLNVSKKASLIAKKYLYIYNENQDLITVYFVNDNNNCDSCFHTIHFQSNKSSETSQLGWKAFGEYQDQYNHYSITYLFVFNGIYLKYFQITYTIQESMKDYILKTIFHRER